VLPPYADQGVADEVLTVEDFVTFGYIYGGSIKPKEGDG
jgi:hypothetical protein